MSVLESLMLDTRLCLVSAAMPAAPTAQLTTRPLPGAGHIWQYQLTHLTEHSSTSGFTQVCERVRVVLECGMWV